MATIDRRVEEWKRRLLDLSGRNPLLYFGRSRTTVVQITAPSPDVLLSALVDGKSLRFPAPFQRSLLDLLAAEDEPREVQRQVVRQGDLETAGQVEELQRKLSRLRSAGRSSVEEQGINTLYAALGFLEWRESDQAQEIVRSPLVLAPVGLRYERNTPYALESLDEDITDNPALKYRLELDFRLPLPPLPEALSGKTLLDYLADVQRLVDSRGWRVCAESWLGIFYFESLVLYRDISDNMSLYKAHPVLQWLAGDATPSNPELPDLTELDSVAAPRDLFPVLDADDSQLEVLIRARAGQNLVVHGPPGTGKSQTIANLIAQSLRDGKTVLFVSRKVAALEVVYDRLKEAGLGDLCLEVHSHRANKRDVISRLNESLERGPHPREEPVAEFDHLSRLRDQLNDYARALRQPMDARGRFAYQVHGILAELSATPHVRSPLTPQEAFDLSREREEELFSCINGVAALAPVFDQWKSHPWRGAALRRIDPETSLQISEALTVAEQSLRDLDQLWPAFAHITGLSPCANLAGLPHAIRVAKHVEHAPPMPKPLLAIQRDRLSRLLAETRECVQRQEQMEQARATFTELFSPGILTAPVTELAERYRGSYGSFLRVLKPSYKRDKSLLRPFMVDDKAMGYGETLRALAACVDFIECRDWLAEKTEGWRPLLGNLVESGASGDWSRAAETVGWLDVLYGLTQSPGLPPSLAEALETRISSLRQEGNQAAVRLESILRNLTGSVVDLTKVFPMGFDGTAFGAFEPGALHRQVDVWLASLDSLDDWAAFCRALDRCAHLGLLAFVNDAKERGMAAATLAALLRKALAAAWLVEAQNRQPILAEFNSAAHEQLREEFRKLDKNLRRAAVRITLARASANRPLLTGGAAGTSDVGILRHQAQLQRRHQPLRRLFPAIRELLPRLKPCLLMSPLSVASYLPPGAMTFDLVVFDEASQIPPEEALGAIVRGRQIVVAGDEKQLPPTSFFASMAARDPTEDDDDEVDFSPLTDSILEECVPLFPEAYLRWHYRSRKEALIAFSNHEFYAGRLVTFPNPEYEIGNGGVRLIHVPEGAFERGGSRTNRLEARRVAEMVVEHLRQHPNRSLGVIAMSVGQQEAIERELARLRLENPSLEEAFREDGVEHLFVKNLERVQGDERDSIILSLGYGPDQQGVVRMQFGPLSRSGGNRRLNVAVTRAKWETTLVTSLLPHQLDPSRLSTGSADVAVLQRYLEYASSGGILSADPSGPRGAPESPFEEAVLDRLRREGLRVDPQVGASAFRIDLAVHHPDRPGRYILGIECDGATFHRAASARERDRLRQEILEGLGWHIFRVWSTDWIRQEDRVVSRILSTIEELRRYPDERGTDSPTREPNETDQVAVEEEALSADPVAAPAQAEEPYDSRLKLPTYQRYARSVGDPDDFYVATPEEIGRVVAEVVFLESPVHLDAVVQRIAAAYGIRRAGSNIRAKIVQGVLIAVSSTLIRQDEHSLWDLDQTTFEPEQLAAMRRALGPEFLWRLGQETVEPRQPAPGYPVRRIDEIAQLELAAASNWVLREQLRMPREELVRQTARLLGYNRVGPVVAEQINRTIGWMLNLGLYSEQEGAVSSVRLPPPQP